MKDDATAVGNLQKETRITGRSYYNMQGQQLTAPPHGSQVYITKERHTDGSISTKKHLKH